MAATPEGRRLARELAAPTPRKHHGAILSVGNIPACPCGCGREDGVMVETPIGPCVLTSWAYVDQVIQQITTAAERQWGKRP